MLDKILHGDCLELMKDIPDKSIDMVLTSPPYDNLRTYNGSLEWGEHVWKPVIQELYRVTKDGGVVVWVVGDATINGSETGTSFKQALCAKDCGFNLHDTMIYRKINYIPLTHNRYEQAFEYMFVFTKGKLKTFNPIKVPCKTAGSKTTGRTFYQTSNSGTPSAGHRNESVAKEKQKENVWDLSTNSGTKGHPAQFPEQLAIDHIISWSNEGDTILDPFAGSGTTGVACKNTGRNYILMEKEQEYIDIINKRLQ